MAYRADPIDVADGAAELQRLWRDNLPVEGDLAAKHRWAYLDAPGGRADALVVRAADGAAVGCAGVEARALQLGGAALRAALLADFAVDRAHRTGLPAVLLQRAVQRHVEPRFDLSYGFPNAAAVAVHRRTGYHELGQMPRYVRPLRFATYLTRRYGRPRLSAAAALALDPLALAESAARALPGARTWRLAWLADVDARFDALWARAAPALPIACRRDAAMLRWRFLRAPGPGHRVAALLGRGDGRLAAYAVVRAGPGGAPGGPGRGRRAADRGDGGTMAELVDLLGESPAALDALLARLVPALALRGHSAISVRYLGAPLVPALLARHRFRRRGDGRAIVVRPTARCPVEPALLLDPARWYLTDLDEDT